MKTLTTTDFFNYLNSLNLFRISIKKDSSGFTAILSKNSKPDLKDFTQVSEDDYGYPLVRLSSKDFYNSEITNGFFN